MYVNNCNSSVRIVASEQAMGNVLEVNRSVGVRAAGIAASSESKVVRTISSPDTASRSSYC